MADKAISELIAAEQVKSADLFVLEQDGAAKKLPAQILENWLLFMAQGHGGIQSIDKVGTSGLVDTYRITLADTTTFNFPVTNGRSVQTIKKTSSSGLVDTYTISYNNGTTSTFTVTNGAKGDKGDNAYTWVKYASQEPTEESHSMGDIPDVWRGEYNGPLASAPTDWKQYKWYKIKGDKGNTGDPARLLTSSTTYMVSDSGTIVPSGSWQSSVPAVPQGKYLWTRVIQTYNTGSPVTSYSVSRMGLDGSGAVSTVNSKNPDSSGNVTITTDDISSGAGSLTNALKGKQPTVTASGLLKGDGNGAVTAARKDVDYASTNYVDTRHLTYSVVLSASKWANNLQTVSATGVTADTTKTDVIASPAPADANYTAYMECGVRLYAQKDGAVQFKCTDVPAIDLTVNLLVRR